MGGVRAGMGRGTQETHMNGPYLYFKLGGGYLGVHCSLNYV